MNSKVLIFGEESFSNFLLAKIQEISDIETSTVNTLPALDSAIRPNCPGLIVLQNESLIGPWLEQFQQQPVHRWVYCLIVDTQANHQSLSEVEKHANALRLGADAYLALGADYGEKEAASPQLQLLQAHVQTGIAHMQKYLELAEVNDLLSAIALSDGLTQLGNRRAFDWELPRQIQISRAQGLPLCLLMLDIDYFKRVNDTHGHVVGDQVLQILAERLRHNLRFYETLFRYGGEEFVIVLNNTTAEEAMQIGDRLRRIIGQQPFVVKTALELSITVSIGISSLTDEDDPNGYSLLNRTDQNLLKAKSSGRDRIIQSE